MIIIINIPYWSQGCATLAPKSSYIVALKKASRKSLFAEDHMLGALYLTGSLCFFHRALAPIMIARFVRLIEIYFNFFRENYFLYL